MFKQYNLLVLQNDINGLRRICSNQFATVCFLLLFLFVLQLCSDFHMCAAKPEQIE